MSDEEFEREIAGRLAFDRRAFIRKMVVGAAFAAPAIASFNMVGLGAGTAEGRTFLSNTSICGKLNKELRAVQTAYSNSASSPQAQRILLAEENSIRQQLAANHCL